MSSAGRQKVVYSIVGVQPFIAHLHRLCCCLLRLVLITAGSLAKKANKDGSSGDHLSQALPVAKSKQLRFCCGIYSFLLMLVIILVVKLVM